MSVELKICGINSENIIHTIIKCGGCQYLGFVFYSNSPRNLSVEKSKKLTSIVPKNIKTVAVLVNPNNEFVEKIKDQFDYLQLYDTTPSRVQELKLISIFLETRDAFSILFILIPPARNHSLISILFK